MSLILCKEELNKFIIKQKESNNKIGITTGSFDILHAGHIHLLKMSKKYCDKLIVALATDNVISYFKGKDRPINPFEDRRLVLGSIKHVDFIFKNEYKYTKNLLKNLEIDIFIKSSKKDTCEIEMLKRRGINYKLIKPYKQKSTSKIVEK